MYFSEWGSGKEEKQVRLGLSEIRMKISVEYLISHVCGINYCYLGNNYLYTMKDGRLYIISSNTAKGMWLDWWNTKSDTYKKDLISKDYSQRKSPHLQFDL